MPILFIYTISLLFMSNSKSVLSKVTDLQVGGKSFLQFCFLLSVAFLYFFRDLWSGGRLIYRGIRQSLRPSYSKEKIYTTYNIHWQIRGKSLVIQMCVYILLVYRPSSFPMGISDTEPEESFLQRDRLALPGPWPGRLLWRTMKPPMPWKEKLFMNFF